MYIIKICKSYDNESIMHTNFVDIVNTISHLFIRKTL